MSKHPSSSAYHHDFRVAIADTQLSEYKRSLRAKQPMRSRLRGSWLPPLSFSLSSSFVFLALYRADYNACVAPANSPRCAILAWTRVFLPCVLLPRACCVYNNARLPWRVVKVNIFVASKYASRSRWCCFFILNSGCGFFVNFWIVYFSYVWLVNF